MLSCRLAAYSRCAHRRRGLALPPMRRGLACLGVVIGFLSVASAAAGGATTTARPFASAARAAATPWWLIGARIIVPGNPANQDCRTGVCRHNENTDLTRWRGAIYLVHRTAGSQVLGPNSSLRVYRSQDSGKSFRLQAIIPAPSGRDIRDPCFYAVGQQLYIKAITRLPGFALRDAGAGSISVEMHSVNGRTWSMPKAIGPLGWGFWRVVKHRGNYYSAAYQDGDLRVVLYRSANGRAAVFLRSEAVLLGTTSGASHTRRRAPALRCRRGHRAQSRSPACVRWPAPTLAALRSMSPCRATRSPSR